jgi:hypothetical protein
MTTNLSHEDLDDALRKILALAKRRVRVGRRTQGYRGLAGYLGSQQREALRQEGNS